MCVITCTADVKYVSVKIKLQFIQNTVRPSMRTNVCLHVRVPYLNSNAKCNARLKAICEAT